MDKYPKLIGTHRFVFNNDHNGGEALVLITEIYHNGDPGRNNIFYNQKIELNSYGNSAGIHLYSAQLTPDTLRKLANELEKAEAEARVKNNVY